jgi:hypothetical protein
MNAFSGVHGDAPLCRATLTQARTMGERRAQQAWRSGRFNDRSVDGRPAGASWKRSVVWSCCFDYAADVNLAAPARDSS